MADETQPLDEQLTAAFEEQSFPIRHEADLMVGFPSWENTRFYTDESTMTPRELLGYVPDEYPYRTVDDLVAALELSLREAGYDI